MPPLSTTHTLLIQDSRNCADLPDGSVNLVVTSPPYPMIEMWDELFAGESPDIAEALRRGDGRIAFELMHNRLDGVWRAAERVLIDGGIACVNIGDAVRSLDGSFRLYPNHARIIAVFSKLGFDTLPFIIWRKQTNAPNKFMGSGMLPAGAYVTLEHEYILIFRKGGKRDFSSPKQKENRRKSALFWEERNTWFSDIWDFKGSRQDVLPPGTRGRSAAFPFELAYRLINMFSCRGETVLDPFLGTGTTLLAAAAAGRSGVGIEIEGRLLDTIRRNLLGSISMLNDRIEKRIDGHRAFADDYFRERPAKYRNAFFDFPVVTSQERDIEFRYIRTLTETETGRFRIEYDTRAGGRAPAVRPGVQQELL